MYCLLACALLIFLLCGRPGLVSQLPYDGAYMSRERTCMINGIFIWIVFMSHLQSYQSPWSAWDVPILKTIEYMGQTMVSTFFFFSGYGIMSSLSKKGLPYSRQLVTHRFFRLLLHFGIAVIVFWAIQSCMGIHYEVERVLYSLIAWSRIENSNWFIFVTLTSYLVIALNYWLLHRWGNVAVVGSVVAGFLILMPFLLTLKGSYWVDAFLCIPAGMLFCIYRESIESKVRKIPVPVWLLGGILFFIGLMVYRVLPVQINFRLGGVVPPAVLVLVQNLGCILLAVGVCLLSAGVRWVRTPLFLVWSGGAALFYLYIFQRIPMMIGKSWGLHETCPTAYQTACFICTLIIAWVCCRIFPRVDSLIWRAKK